MYSKWERRNLKACVDYSLLWLKLSVASYYPQSKVYPVYGARHNWASCLFNTPPHFTQSQWSAWGSLLGVVESDGPTFQCWFVPTTWPFGLFEPCFTYQWMELIASASQNIVGQERQRGMDTSMYTANAKFSILTNSKKPVWISVLWTNSQELSNSGVLSYLWVSIHSFSTCYALRTTWGTGDLAGN